MKRVVVWLMAAVLCAALTSCATTPSKPSENVGPEISNLRFEPTDKPTHGEMIYVVFDCDDRGHDLELLYRQWKSPDRDFDFRQVSKFSKMSPPNLIREGKTIKFRAVFNMPMTVFVTVWVKDAAGDTSNKLEGVIRAQ